MPSGQSANPIKIIFVITQGEWGGAQRYVYDLATNLDRAGYEILVVSGNEKLELSDKLKAAGIAVRLAKNLVRNISPLRELAAIWELKNILEDFKPDILHLNSTKAGILGSLAGKLAGVNNIIFTAHGFHFLEPHNWLVRKISFWLEKFATKFRKRIICVSEYDRQAAIKAGLCPAEKLIIIHNGISLDTPPHEKGLGEVIENNALYDPLSISPSRGGERKIMIGTIANLYPTKGLEYLIDAAKQITAKFRAVQFVVIGEGPQRRYLESRITNYGLEKQFFLLGKIPNAARHLSNFDIFVLPSLKEGFPYTLLEAMRAGLPIVATKVGGVPEALGHESEGLLVEPKDPRALTNAIHKLLAESELRKKYGANAKNKSLDFTLEKMVQETKKVYRELLSNF